jgi:hypothetical protein
VIGTAEENSLKREGKEEKLNGSKNGRKKK